MELEDFVKKVILDLVNGVGGAGKESSRDITLAHHKDTNQTIEFDIAVTVESTSKAEGKAGIKVFQIVEGGGGASKESKNSTVSRVKFGVYVDPLTKEQNAQRASETRDLSVGGDGLEG